MADYRTPLPALFAGALETAINHLLALDESSGKGLSRLEGKLLQQAFVSPEHKEAVAAFLEKHTPDFVAAGATEQKAGGAA